MFDLYIGGCLFLIGDEGSGVLRDVEVDLAVLNAVDAENVGFQLILQIQLVSLSGIGRCGGKGIGKSIFECILLRSKLGSGIL